MLSLHDLQTQFEIDIFSEKDAELSYIRKDGILAKDRIEIYRNNIFSNYRKTLSTVFPVIEKLIGEHFFHQTANAYIYAYPSLSGDLNEYGANFSQFLTSYEPVNSLPYLADVASLEWLVELVFRAEDEMSSVIEKLAYIPEDQFDELRFKLNAATYLFESNYPIAKIWQVNQDDWQGDNEVDLRLGGSKLLIYRQNFSITIKPLTEGEFLMLQGLDAGQKINSVFCKAIEVQNDLDLGSFLQQMIHNDVLVDVLL